MVRRKVPDLRHKIPEYQVSKHVKGSYEAELLSWIHDSWLLLNHQKRLSPFKGLVPLIAVIQHNMHKVHPVMDNRELNEYVDTFTCNADVCAAKLREWCKRDTNVSLLDLKRAYLQICIDKSLLPDQSEIFKGQRYCIMWLGFDLNVAPLIMSGLVVWGCRIHRLLLWRRVRLPQ